MHIWNMDLTSLHMRSKAGSFSLKTSTVDRTWRQRMCLGEGKWHLVPLAVLSGVYGQVRAFRSDPISFLLDPIRKAHSQAYKVSVLWMCDIAYLYIMVLLQWILWSGRSHGLPTGGLFHKFQLWEQRLNNGLVFVVLLGLCSVWGQ